MTIYYYHSETLMYLGSGEADESPLEPGVFLIPASATSVQPPEIPEGKMAVFAEGVWSLQDIPTSEPGPEPEPEPEPEAPTMESFASSQGYTVFDLLNLSDIERHFEAENIPLPEKSTAVRQWVNAVRTAFLINQTPPTAPYTLGEVLEEIAALTQI
jgi:hypothetical protein